LALLLAPTLLAPMLLVGTAASAFGNRAVILNSDEDSLSIIDTGNFKELSRQRIGRSPHHLIASPDGRTLVVALAGGNQLALLDLASSALSGTDRAEEADSPGADIGLKERVTASDPYQIGFSPDGKWFVAASLRLDRIDLYDAAGFRLVHRLAADTMPSHIGFSPDSGTAYVTLQGTNSLIAIDLASGKPRWKVPVGRQPAGVLVRPSGTVLVANMGSDHIAEVDPKDGSIIRRVRTGAGAHNFLLSRDGKTLYVTNRVAGTISVLDAATLDVTGTIKTGGGPDDMAWSPDGREMWVTNRWRASVSVVDPAAGIVKTIIPVGRSPHGIFVF
jgi:YVTN family beta-propeller protein